MAETYIGLGSNLGDRLEHLCRALDRLDSSCAVKKVSSLYETEPVDDAGPYEFLNAVVLVETSLPPRELLCFLHEIEDERERVRRSRNEPRTLDLDILLYDQWIVREQDLVIPHPRLHQRRFVLAPLAELAPSLQHPILGVAVGKLEELLRVGGTVKPVAQQWWKR